MAMNQKNSFVLNDGGLPTAAKTKEVSKYIMKV